MHGSHLGVLLKIAVLADVCRCCPEVSESMGQLLGLHGKYRYRTVRPAELRLFKLDSGWVQTLRARHVNASLYTALNWITLSSTCHLADTLHRFCKKEHDWGWKKFMELSKVLDGFTAADTLIIKAQVQVIL